MASLSFSAFLRCPRTAVDFLAVFLVGNPLHGCHDNDIAYDDSCQDLKLKYSFSFLFRHLLVLNKMGGEGEAERAVHILQVRVILGKGKFEGPVICTIQKINE